jgi:hypothetical protein
MNELSKKNQLLILQTYKDYYAFFTYALSYSLHNTTSMLNSDNVNYGSATVVSIVLQVSNISIWLKNIDYSKLDLFRIYMYSLKTAITHMNSKHVNISLRNIFYI